MFGSRRSLTLSPPAAATSSEAEDRPEQRLVEALDGLRAARLAGAALPEGRVGHALGDLLRLLEEDSRRDLAATVAVASEASEAAANIGWMTHDIAEMASSTSSISGAVEELAASIAQLSQTSGASAMEAEAARDGMRGCIAQMRRGSDAMAVISTGVAGIGERLGSLEEAVAQIAAMAGTIETISRQTNLLALNATIEAARAGAAGAGFAVVAGEVKSLSGQTAQATEQIRQRVGTLVTGMRAIAKAVEDSCLAVGEGHDTIRGVEAGIETVGAQIDGITDNMRALAEVLGQQQGATNSIAVSVGDIAGKAAKSKGEIAAVLERLTGAEQTAQACFDRAAGRPIAAYPLVRFPADAAAWKRRLAAVLVGAAPAREETAVLGERIARRHCETAAAGAPAATAFLQAEHKAHAEALRLVRAVAARRWDEATPAFMACEAALAAAVAAAGTLAGAA
ncbi:methyl-accepting chemotaxis protein [Labrys wisconsinensis]|uniref:Uncharacterized protein YoxC n=1 Tax=Labrys wisconsinensis TaxID=425677 RepID=A0ABU0JHP1_9HYPH|nr:methyl-accepting chemotaxis protein [Labrys wisconsinensis]MDQ0472933.1 uncharacterized protein YoxC [Labrys wisconsinensis]